MATIKQPHAEDPPLCSCGCNTLVNWMPGKGWATFRKGHQSRDKPGSRRGAILTPETKTRMSEAAKNRYKGKRQRDLGNLAGVYSTHEYREARERLVKGRPCSRCGTTKNVHSHHVIPGDDESLIPMCRKCHPTEHCTVVEPKGKHPPPGENPPLCRCGCGQSVKWKRIRGWGKCLRGHAAAKIPTGTANQDPPFCKCGCGQTTKYRFGQGWGEYCRGHRQRDEGAFRFKNK